MSRTKATPFWKRDEKLVDLQEARAALKAAIADPTPTLIDRANLKVYCVGVELRPDANLMVLGELSIGTLLNKVEALIAERSPQ